MTQIKGKPVEASAEAIEAKSNSRKPYARPLILHKLELETRAGTPLHPDPDEEMPPWPPLGWR